MRKLCLLIVAAGLLCILCVVIIRTIHKSEQAASTAAPVAPVTWGTSSLPVQKDAAVSSQSGRPAIQRPDPIPYGMTAEEFDIAFIRTGDPDLAYKIYQLIDSKMDGEERKVNQRAILQHFGQIAKIEDVPAFLEKVRADSSYVTGAAEFLKRLAASNPGLGLNFLASKSGQYGCRVMADAFAQNADPNELSKLLNASTDRKFTAEERFEMVQQIHLKLFKQGGGGENAFNAAAEDNRISNSEKSNLLCRLINEQDAVGLSSAELLLRQSDQTNLDLAYRAMILKWTTQEPRTAAAWLDTHLDSKFAAGMAATMTEKWLSSDSIRASEWVAKLAPSEAKQAAMAKVASYVLVDSPQEALPWIQGLKDSKEKKAMLDVAVRAINAVH